MPDGDVETFREGDAWLNQVTGHGQVAGSYDTKQEAVDAGRRLARTLKVEHIIKNESGQISERNSYVNDP